MAFIFNALKINAMLSKISNNLNKIVGHMDITDSVHATNVKKVNKLT